MDTRDVIDVNYTNVTKPGQSVIRRKPIPRDVTRAYVHVTGHFWSYVIGGMGFNVLAGVTALTDPPVVIGAVAVPLFGVCAMLLVSAAEMTKRSFNRARR